MQQSDAAPDGKPRSDAAGAGKPLSDAAGAGDGASDPRHRQVLAALGTVLDPELDEPLTDLGFIHAVDVAGGEVTVTLRLPTYWCSANFAYIMGEDILAAVGDLPWATRVVCRLVDHFAARRVNDGLASGKSFREAFGKEAEADLGEVRADFRDKSFLGRQATLIQAMRREKVPAERIVATMVADLETRAATAGPEHARQVRRYLEARRARPVPAGAQDLAFLTIGGEPVPADRLLDHLREARRIRGSFESNAELCRILLAARYGDNPAPETAPRAGGCQNNEEHSYERG